MRFKNKLRKGKITRYKRNRRTDPSSFMCRGKKSEKLRTISCRAEPKIKDDGPVHLVKIGAIRVKSEFPEGRPASFQLKDVTTKFTGRTRDGDRKFLLLVQVKIPDPAPATGRLAGVDYGVTIPAAVSDEDGNEMLYRHSGGCARQKGDKTDMLRRNLSRYVKGSRNYKATR